MPRILLVEDEKQLSDALCQILMKNKYEVYPAYDGETGLDEALSGIYDTVLLDIMLPKRDGLSILRELRKQKISTPVLLLTAKGEVQDKVKGLDCGADDYLSKPFSTEELLARLRALSRRKGEIIVDNALQFADISLDLSSYELSAEGRSVKLSSKELEMMRYFLLRPSAVADKEDLMVKVWGYDSAAESNTLEVYISFLRKKLQYLHSRVKITCLRGVGYQLEDTLCSKI